MKPDNDENNSLIITAFIQNINELLENMSTGKYVQLSPNDTLPEDLKHLVKQINRISEMLKELEEYSLALSKGDLDVVPPNRKNFLAAGVKTLHAQLNHVTWQAQQVSKGDYNQVVDFMGEFSRAFNTMTAMLKKRELMSQERQKSLMDIFDNLNLIIAVLDNQNKSILFLNETAIKYGQEHSSINNGQERESLLSSMIVKNLPEIGASSFFFENYTGRWYEIECMPIDWQDEKKAVLCTLLDITQMKQTEMNLRIAAEIDPLTGVYRRDAGISVFHNSMKPNYKQEYVVCFLDVDGLKGINDKYGHGTGDAAIRGVADILKLSLRDTDIIMRMGGDEFLFILMNCNNNRAHKVHKRVFEILEEYNQESKLPFKISFSIGMSNPAKNREDIEALIEDADALMYQEKQRKYGLG